ncbi:ABC transporter permease [Micromonospora sp. NPDC049679]|uniref:ABC transporter permease n=1 Tax=Micromonospora sp. NPDC049679 TaxID=3155920 RepID=UPI0033E8DDBA
MKQHVRVPWPLRVLCVVVGLWLVAPTFVVIPLSFTGEQSFNFPPESWSLTYYKQFFTDPAWTDALLVSVQLAVWVTLLATVLGTAAAFALVRGRIRVAVAAQGLLLLPMIIPQIVVAIAIYIAFLEWGLQGTMIGLVVAHTALAIPFVVITVSASIRTLDRRIEHAAASLGASPITVLRLIIAPLIVPGVLSGAVFAFVTSFDEVVISLYLQSPDLRPLPVQMFTSVTYNIDPTMAAASSIIVTATTLLLLLPQMIGRRKKRTRTEEQPAAVSA